MDGARNGVRLGEDEDAGIQSTHCPSMLLTFRLRSIVICDSRRFPNCGRTTVQGHARTLMKRNHRSRRKYDSLASWISILVFSHSDHTEPNMRAVLTKYRPDLGGFGGQRRQIAAQA